MRGRGRLSSRRISSVESVGSVTIKLYTFVNVIERKFALDYDVR